MRKLMLCLIGITGLFSLTGCVVYDPRPRVYAYPAYYAYPEPAVVVYEGGYYHRRCYRYYR